jgi:3-isopropylmalate/(R)-2-methylmalate dehydratase small subunit
MQPFTRLTGIAAPLDRDNVDTDQIIPAVHLKRIERTGFGQFLFQSWRFLPDGSPNPDFELNHPGYRGARILLAGRNFGCGSSREHAPWALHDYGYRAIIAPSFADIFRSNCFQNGMLPLVLPPEQVSQLMAQAKAHPGYRVTVDLERQMVTDGQGFEASFEVDPFRRRCLLQGLDDIGLTLQHDEKVRAYEARHWPGRS